MLSLCVPFSAKAQARVAGATWNAAEKVWQCDQGLLAGDGYAALRPFLSRMYRREVRRPFIRPFMVPQRSWGKNLRSVLDVEDWKRVRRYAYDAAGSRCIVCGGRGPEWPVEADEAWDYDDDRSVQTLKGVIALCPPCHLVRHWGHTTVSGRAEIAIAQMVRVNGWTRPQAEAAGDAGLRLWEARSRRRWHMDYSWVTRVHGIVVDEAGLARAEDANQTFVEEARAGRGNSPW